MHDKLPVRLKKEPIIDAIFEMRFSANEPAASVIPGIIFNKLSGEKKIFRLPVADLPKSIRDFDPNLAFTPLVNIIWKDFNILIGDSSIAVGCPQPYPMWPTFRQNIQEVMDAISDIAFIDTINRFSLKYVDLINFTGIDDQIAAIEMSISLAKFRLSKEVFSLRIEMPQPDFLQILQIISSAVATLPNGAKREGIIVDIDTIVDNINLSFSDWKINLPEQLNQAHQASKELFFKCITSKTLEFLEPEYE